MATSKLAVSFNNKKFDRQIDKVTQKELNVLLNEKIDEAYSHQFDEVKHITDAERDKWNNIINTIKPATNGVDGLMSAKDKAKLDSIAANANNYMHPNSGVKPGSYTCVNVNEQGHIIYGDNPTRLDITARDSERLGGRNPNEYALINSPTFTGTVKVPAVTISSNPRSPVTVELLESYVQTQLNKAWPIGSVYLTMSNQNPADLIGGKWVKIAGGRFIMGSDNDHPVRSTGGNNSVKLNVDNMPSHSHGVSINGETDWAGDHNHGTGWGERINENIYPPHGLYGNRNSNKFGSAHSDWDNLEYATSINGNHKHNINIWANIQSSGRDNPNSIDITNPYLSVNIWERVG